MIIIPLGPKVPELVRLAASREKIPSHATCARQGLEKIVVVQAQPFSEVLFTEKVAESSTACVVSALLRSCVLHFCRRRRFLRITKLEFQTRSPPRVFGMKSNRRFPSAARPVEKRHRPLRERHFKSIWGYAAAILLLLYRQYTQDPKS